MKPPTSEPGLFGYIDRTQPHSVNQVVIADLGDQEILVCACDDGDVYAYYTSTLSKAIQRRQQSDCEETNDINEIGPFLLVNLGSSAWGIAVHKEARLIAVSTNLHVVNVLAFALLHSTKETAGSRNSSPARSDRSENTLQSSERSTASDGTSTQRQEHGWPVFASYGESRMLEQAMKRRDQDMRIQLLAHDHNIPAVAFCNSEEDQTGRHLASTDIIGLTIIWDIHKGIRLRAIYPVNDMMGWSLQWLDPRAFFHTAPDEALKPYDVYYTGHAINLMNTTAPRTIVEQQTKSAHAWRWGGGHDPEGIYSAIISDTGDNSDFSEESEEADNGGSRSFSHASLGSPGLDLWGTPVLNTAALHTNEIAAAGARTTATSVSTIHLNTSHTTLPRPRDRRQASSISRQPPDRHAICSIRPNYTWPPDCPSPSEVWIPPHPPATPLPTYPIMLFTERNIALFPSPLFEDTPPARPMVFTSDPLEQTVPPIIMRANERHSKFNMTLQIPELGIVVAGSPSGRVCLMTLHQVWPNPFADDAKGKAQPVFLHRVDVVLPTKGQEARNERPTEVLVGIASGPVFDASYEDCCVSNGVFRPRRWKLLLLYMDETVLSYEIWRDRPLNARANDAVHRTLQAQPLV